MANASVCYKICYIRFENGGNYLDLTNMYPSWNFYTKILAFFPFAMLFLMVLKDCSNFIEFLNLFRRRFTEILYLRISFDISC